MQPDDEPLELPETVSPQIDEGHEQDLDDPTELVMDLDRQLESLQVWVSPTDADLAQAIEREAATQNRLPIRVHDIKRHASKDAAAPEPQAAPGSAELISLAGVIVAILNFAYDIWHDYVRDHRERDNETWRKSLSVALLSQGIDSYKVRSVRGFDDWRKGIANSLVVIETPDGVQYAVTLAPDNNTAVVMIERA